MHYYRGVDDAKSFGGDIIEAIREGGWYVDVENTDLVGEEQHSSGVWLYGAGAFPNRFCQTLAADYIQDAFKAAGVKLHLNSEYPSQRINLVIGTRER